jgi:membrane-bound lytic murein transglycosylase A
MLAACSSKPTDRGQQYSEGKFTQPFSLVNQPDAVGSPINAGDFSEQVRQIRSASPRLIIARATSITRCRSGCVPVAIPAP